MISESVLGGFLSLVCDRPVGVQVQFGSPDIQVDPEDGTVNITTPTGDAETLRAFAALAAGKLLDDGEWAAKAWSGAPKGLHAPLRTCWPAVSVLVAHNVAKSRNEELARRIVAGRSLGVGRIVTNGGDEELSSLLGYASSGWESDRERLPGEVAKKVDAAVKKVGKDPAAGFIALARIVARYDTPGVPVMAPLSPAAGLTGGDGGNAPSDATAGQHEAMWVPVSAMASKAWNAIAAAATRRRLEEEPEWHHDVPTGRLNLRAVAQPVVDPQTAFSEIRCRNGDTRRAVVLIDASLSMRNRIVWATECAWALGAMGNTEWHVFDSKVHPWPLQRRSGTIAVPTVAGGTAPGEDMLRAMKGARAVAIISDGDFENPGMVHDMMRAAVSDGALLVTMGFDAPGLPRRDDPVGAAIVMGNYG